MRLSDNRTGNVSDSVAPASRRLSCGRLAYRAEGEVAAPLLIAKYQV